MTMRIQLLGRICMVCAASVGLIAISPLVAAATTDGPVAVTVQEDTEQHIVLDYVVGDFRQLPVVIDGATWTKVVLGSEAPRLVAGDPELPTIERSVIIPNDAHMTIGIRGAEFYELSMDVVPSKGSLLRTIDPADVPYTFGPAYTTDAFYPGTVAELGEPYIMRDYRGLVVHVYPFQYNPVSGVLRVYTHINIEITNVGPGQINVLQDETQRALSLGFHELYSHHFINYASQERYPPMSEEGDMLIIAHDAWLSNIQPFADHKNAIGIDTTVVGVSTIPGGNNAAAIKSYIQEMYGISDLAFVLLVGDGAQIDTMVASGGSSDPSYALLAGSDSYPEIFIGRFSAETAAHVDTQVQRTIEYELMPATMQDWFKKGTGIASNQGPGDDGEYDYQHIDNIRLDLLDYGYTQVDQIYDPSATAAQVTAALNDGRGIINYCGHGSTTSWSTTGFSNSDINALVNDSKLPFICSVACVNGQFDGYTCFAEAWLRATNGGEPTGAIAAYMSSVNQYWDEPMCAQDEFVDLLAGENYHSFGALTYCGSCLMMDEYGSSGVDMYNTWHIFGDPSLRVFGTAEPPTGLSVSPFGGLNSEGPNGGPFTPDSIVYTLENHNDAGLDYEVLHTEPWVTVTNESGFLPAHSTTEVTVEISSMANGMVNGEYTDVLEFMNMTDHDGDTTRTVSLTVGVPQAIMLYPLDSDPGWDMFGEWAFGRPVGAGGDAHGFPDPSGGASGSYVCGVNLAGDYSIEPGGPYFLTTTAMDCSELTQVSLRFKRWLNSDYEPYVSATIEVSNDGTDWTLIWENGTSEMSENAWSSQVYDISTVADHQPTVYVRWGYEVGSGAYAYSGWNIDDVEIWGLMPSSCMGDIDGDGAVGVNDLLELLAGWGPCLGCPADLDNNNQVDVNDLLALLAAWGAC